MKASEIVAALQVMMARHGDCDVYLWEHEEIGYYRLAAMTGFRHEEIEQIFMPTHDNADHAFTLERAALDRYNEGQNNA